MEENTKVEGKKITLATLIVIIINTILLIGVVISITSDTGGCSPNNPMTDIQISAFNGRFNIYEGKIYGSQVKSLLKAIQTNNESYEGTELIVTLNNLLPQDLPTLKNSMKYIVEMEKEDGAISNINVYNYDINKEKNIGEKIEVIGTQPISKIKENNNYDKDLELEINWEAIIFAIIVSSPIIICYFNSKSKKIAVNNDVEDYNKKMNKLNKNASIVYTIIIICSCVISYSLIGYIIDMNNNVVAYKPIIYIYPQEQTEVVVELGRKENLTCTYPEYKDKWVVTANTDGTLIDTETGRTYYALYWEGINSKKYNKKLEEGFVVEGKDTAKFLEEKLEILGLNEREAEEFIVYWLPKMQNNKYNYIRFQTMEEIDANMPLDITPKPDNLIRVMMEWKGLNKFINIEEQKLEKVERKGYTIVEWGGTEIK